MTAGLSRLSNSSMFGSLEKVRLRLSLGLRSGGSGSKSDVELVMVCGAVVMCELDGRYDESGINVDGLS